MNITIRTNDNMLHFYDNAVIRIKKRYDDYIFLINSISSNMPFLEWYMYNDVVDLILTQINPLNETVER